MGNIKKMNAVTKIYSIPFRGIGEMIFGGLFIVISLYSTVVLLLLKTSKALASYGFIFLALFLIFIILSLYGVHRSRQWYFKRYGKLLNVKYILISTLLIIITMSFGTGIIAKTGSTHYNLIVQIVSIIIECGFIVIYLNYLRYSLQYIFVAIAYVLMTLININSDIVVVIYGILVFSV